MSVSKKHVLVLSSGGIDSTACIRFFKKMKFDVEAIFFDYGQPSRKNELKAVRAISNYYKIPLRAISIRTDMKFSNGLIQGRNAALYFLGLMHFRGNNGIIAAGIHAGTPYYDCSSTFLENIQGFFDGYTNGTIKPAAPFLTFSKKDIWDYCKTEKVPLSLTYSCERGLKQPCGKCDTCKDILYICKSEAVKLTIH